jgi:prepilin-type N-terminal cleavage/methylation domain-containing protein
MANESKRKFQNGFTFPELIVSLAILLVVFIMITINLSPLPSNTIQAATLDGLINDIKVQQTLSMSDANSYGVHLENGSYTLFEGSTYVPGAVGNFTVTMDEGIGIINITLPSGNLVFLPGSGDIENHAIGSDSFTVQSSLTGKETVVRLNKYAATY